MGLLPIRQDLDADICDAFVSRTSGSGSMKWHSYYLLTLCTGGSGIYQINDREIPVSRGDLLVMSPHDFHCASTKPKEHCDCYGVKFHYDAERFGSLVSGVTFPIRAHLSDRDYALATALLGSLVEECRNTSAGSRAYKRSAVEHLMLLSIRAMEKDAAPGPSGASEKLALRTVLAYIHEHFREPLTVAKLSEVAGFTPNYFSAFFRAQTGQSCLNYIRQFRLDFAAKLLRMGHLTVTEVCFECGFNSLSYFSSAFRSVYGVSPAEYVRNPQVSKIAL